MLFKSSRALHGAEYMHACAVNEAQHTCQLAGHLSFHTAAQIGPYKDGASASTCELGQMDVSNGLQDTCLQELCSMACRTCSHNSAVIAQQHQHHLYLTVSASGCGTISPSLLERVYMLLMVCIFSGTGGRVSDGSTL